MKELPFKFVLFGIVLALGACSSSSKEGDEMEEVLSDDEIPLSDAGTDEVPEASVEELGDYVPEEGGDFAADAPRDPEPSADPGFEDSAPSGGDFATSGTDSYTVQRGDTLMKIAFEIYGDVFQWRRIYNLNSDKLVDPNMITVGMTLNVETPAEPVQITRNGSPYLIKEGDTLGTISRDVYGAENEWKKIWKNNPELIRDPNRIFAGFRLYYEGGSGIDPLAGGGGEEFGFAAEDADPGFPGAPGPGQ